MTVAELEKRIRNRLRDVTGSPEELLWPSEELIDDIANGVRADLFRIVKCFLIDSTTAVDNEGLPLATLPIIAGQSLYAMSPKILQTLRFQLTSQKMPIGGITQQELDIRVPNWRGLTATANNYPYCYCTDYQTDSIYLVPPPFVDDTANLTNSIYPLTDLTAQLPDDGISPDLGFRSEYHKDLIPGMLAICLSKPDSQTYRPELVPKYEDEFTARANQIMLEMHRRSRGGKSAPPLSAFRS